MQSLDEWTGADGVIVTILKRCQAKVWNFVHSLRYWRPIITSDCVIWHSFQLLFHRGQTGLFSSVQNHAPSQFCQLDMCFCLSVSWFS